MNLPRGMIVIAAACAACAAPEVPVEVQVMQAPELLMDVPAQLLLDVRVGVAIDGVEVMVEGDEGLRVMDYAPRILPAMNPTGGHQLFVNLVPKTRGSWKLTVRLTLHMDGEKRIRTLTLPFAVVAPPTGQPTPQGLSVRRDPSDQDSIEITIS